MSTGMFEVQLNRVEMQRIFARIRFAAGDCWEWCGWRQPNGYGRVSWRHERVFIHRLIYAWAVEPLPRGYAMNIDHLCRNRACCNPVHLELVSIKENLARGRRYRHDDNKTHCPKGHPYSGENLYLTKGGGRQCRQCRVANDKRKMERLKTAGRGSEFRGVNRVSLRRWMAHIRINGKQTYLGVFPDPEAAARAYDAAAIRMGDLTRLNF